MVTGKPDPPADSAAGPQEPPLSNDMMSRSLARRWMRRIGWLVGAPLAIFRFLRREILVEQIDGSDPVAPLPAADLRDSPSQTEPGLGPVAHHLYVATTRSPQLATEQLLAIIAADPNVVAPTEVLRFQRPPGTSGSLQKGDEVLIRMAGPWNGPMRVTEKGDERLRLAALPGHPQHGQIELRVRPRNGEHNDIVIELQTRERAAGLSFYLLQRVGLIQRMQSYTWAEILQNAARLAGGQPPDRITIRSWRSTH